MAEEQVKTNKKAVSSDSYSTLARGMMGIQREFSDIPVEEAYKIFIGAGGYGAMLTEPYVQNRRVKGYNTLPEEVTKEDLVDMVKQPNNYEKELRAVSTTLTSTTKTYDLIMQTYQDLLTYDWYIHPTYSPVKVDIDTQKRDLFLAEKIARAINPKKMGHQIVGQCVQYGKVFYTPRVSADKAHNKVNYAFLQQLPEDWCKIVGFNNGPGKYTIAFNMMGQIGDSSAIYSSHIFRCSPKLLRAVRDTFIPQQKNRFLLMLINSISLKLTRLLEILSGM